MIVSLPKCLTILSGLLFCALPAQAACDAGAALEFRLDLQGGKDSQFLDAKLRTVSRLLEKEGDCFRSSSRLDSTLRADVDRFERVLRSEGFYGARISQTAALADTVMHVTVTVDPGEAYQFGNITIDYWAGADQPLDAPPANAPETGYLTSFSGVARAGKVVETERALLLDLTNSGYPFADVLPRDVVVDHATRLVTVTYNVTLGSRHQLGAPVFEGLETIKEAYVARLVPWDSGALFSQRLLDDYKNRLLATGLFRTVRIILPEEGPAADLQPLIKVEEALHRRVEVAGGYAAGEGFEAEVAWTHRNILGAGETLKLSLLGAENEQRLSAAFRKPNWGRFGQALQVRSKVGHENKPAYTADTIDSYVGLERILSRHLSGTAGVAAKLARINTNGGRAYENLFSLPVGLMFDGSNSILDPARGFRANLVVQPTLSARSDDTYFLMTELRASGYWHLPSLDQVTWAVRGRLASIWGADLDRVPDTERLYAGGGGSVRGFGFQSLGPRDSSGDPLGGLSAAEVSLEARVRISQTISLVPFLDGGMTFARQTPSFNGWRWGTGIGLRYHTAVAPIRVDLATPLGRRSGENAISVYISIGQSF